MVFAEVSKEQTWGSNQVTRPSLALTTTRSGDRVESTIPRSSERGDDWSRSARNTGLGPISTTWK